MERVSSLLCSVSKLRKREVLPRLPDACSYMAWFLDVINSKGNFVFTTVHTILKRLTRWEARLWHTSLGSVL
jgi:hypothetical protein